MDKSTTLKLLAFFVFQVQVQEAKESPATKDLYKVLKDHKNQYVEELVRCSYQRCYAEEVRNVTADDLYTQELEACGNERVVRITLVNPKFQIPLASAVEHLIEAKLQIDKFGFTYVATTSQTYTESDEGKRFSDKLAILVNDIATGKLRDVSGQGVQERGPSKVHLLVQVWAKGFSQHSRYQWIFQVTTDPSPEKSNRAVSRPILWVVQTSDDRLRSDRSGWWNLLVHKEQVICGRCHFHRASGKDIP